MGTRWTVMYPGGERPADTLPSAIEHVLARINQQMSTWDPQSVISQLNRAPRGWYQVPAELFHVLSHALSVARESAGIYDPTVGELVDLWGFGPPGAVGAPPRHEDIAAAVQRCGWQKLKLDVKHRGVWQPGGLRLDLSAIAKGYGVDCIADALDQHGLSSYLVEIGRELKARGLRGDGRAWRVGIEIPDGSGAPTLPMTLMNAALATSGDYRRYYMDEGRRYAHTIGVSNGYPIMNALASVSVVHAECMAADALATALLGMGLQNGLAHARQRGIPALFMHRHAGDVSLTWTDAFLALAGRPDGCEAP
jgi:thiamine biosynthesis lipoprotein